MLELTRRPDLETHNRWHVYLADVCVGTISERAGVPEIPGGRAHSRPMGTKSRERIYVASVRAAAERATEARKAADRLACDAWNPGAGDV
jgi:hypothetical protein